MKKQILHKHSAFKRGEEIHHKQQRFVLEKKVEKKRKKRKNNRCACKPPGTPHIVVVQCVCV